MFNDELFTWHKGGEKIKKQTTEKIIISLIFILAIVLGTGAVSASDVNTGDNPQNSASSDELVLIEITGQVEQCSDGEPFQGASVTVSDNGTQIASTTTSADGTYNVSFQSMKRVFTVTASANGHKPSAQTVTINNQETYTCTANFRLGNNDAYVYQGWGTNPDEDYTFSDGTTIHLTGATNAFTTINDGINYATGNPGVNTVYIAPGTYNEYSMSIDTSVTLHGENQDTTIIDADDNARILTIWNDATVSIEQLTFRDGSSEMGGALRVESGTTTITDCTFDSNTVPDYGGAIYVDPVA
ncbi:MAG: carboxypeptidase regulatory-like domain-containing protein, partial [Methanobacterium sp.]|nr:carboxypeptidase regulatory-like domain-containing protein [Methanobacterium sp.]